VLAFLISGCATTQPERVYVDLDRVFGTERPTQTAGLTVPRPPGPAPAVIVKQPGLPATSTGDQTDERLQEAKKLIEENRNRSIATLSSMLERIYVARANDANAVREKAAQPEQSKILASAVTRLRQAFEAYARQRGPLLPRLNALAHGTDLAPVPISEGATPLATRRITEANKLRGQIRSLDAAYDADATKILSDAQKEIEDETAALGRQAEAVRAAAHAQALSEAESQATATQTSLNVQVTKLLPESLPAVASRDVTIPGSRPLAAAPESKNQPIFGSLDEHRRLIDEQIDIWVKSTGGVRSLTPRGAHDRTEEFLQWRSAHKVGP